MSFSFWEPTEDPPTVMVALSHFVIPMKMGIQMSSLPKQGTRKKALDSCFRRNDRKDGLKFQIYFVRILNLTPPYNLLHKALFYGRGALSVLISHTISNSAACRLYNLFSSADNSFVFLNN